MLPETGLASDPVAGCALMRRGGFDVLTGLVDDGVLARLRHEAEACAATARESLVTDPADAERGGVPARKFLSASGGPLQAAFLGAPWLHALLANVVGLPVRQTGGGTFTYYCRAGDHLALHRDILTCDVAVITALRNDNPLHGIGFLRCPDVESGALAVYPHAAGLPLAVIRTRPRDGRLLVDLELGQTCVLLGGLVPHALLPTASGQQRIVSVACFEALPNSISSGLLSRTLRWR